MSDRERKKNEFDPAKVAAISLARLADAADQAALSIDAPSSQNVWLRAFFHASGGGAGTKADVESAASFADDVLASFQKRFPEEKDEEPLEGHDPREDDDDDG